MRYVLRVSMKNNLALSERVLDSCTGSVATGPMQSYEEEQREEKEDEATEEDTETERIQDQAIADILKGVDYEDTDTSKGIRLNQMLRKYSSRKARLEAREKQVSLLS